MMIPKITTPRSLNRAQPDLDTVNLNLSLAVMKSASILESRNHPQTTGDCEQILNERNIHVGCIERIYQRCASSIAGETADNTADGPQDGAEQSSLRSGGSNACTRQSTGNDARGQTGEVTCGWVFAAACRPLTRRWRAVLKSPQTVLSRAARMVLLLLASPDKQPTPSSPEPSASAARRNIL